VASPEFQALKAAFDLWCALWFWPADQLDHAPLPTPFAAGELDDRGRQIAGELAARHRFFHWELEFPDVFNAQSRGFDAILGNPPWETLQAQQQGVLLHLSIRSIVVTASRRQLQSRRTVRAGHGRGAPQWLDYCVYF
jgi:hypothetical protein